MHKIKYSTFPNLELAAWFTGFQIFDIQIHKKICKASSEGVFFYNVIGWHTHSDNVRLTAAKEIGHRNINNTSAGDETLHSLFARWNTSPMNTIKILYSRNGSWYYCVKVRCHRFDPL